MQKHSRITPPSSHRQSKSHVRTTTKAPRRVKTPSRRRSGTTIRDSVPRASRSHGSGARPAPRQGRRQRKVHTLNFSSPKTARLPSGTTRARAPYSSSRTSKAHEPFLPRRGLLLEGVLRAVRGRRERTGREASQAKRAAVSKASDSTGIQHALTNYTTTVATRCHRPHTTARNNKTARARRRVSACSS